jgi:hypothetical protein
LGLGLAGDNGQQGVPAFHEGVGPFPLKAFTKSRNVDARLRDLLESPLGVSAGGREPCGDRAVSQHVAGNVVEPKALHQALQAGRKEAAMVTFETAGVSGSGSRCRANGRIGS